MSRQQDWKGIWARQSSPLHQFSDEEHYRRLGSELAWLWQFRAMPRVIELGCGNGCLFQHLGFERSEIYVGVDFSSSMLAIFQQQYPGLRLINADASEYCDDGCYDLIFSHGLGQYLSFPQMAQLLANVKTMLAKQGLVVIASLPWQGRRFEYLRGLTGRTQPRQWRSTLRGYARIVVKGDSLGHWYNPQDVANLASSQGFGAEFFGSMLYPYRFHAILSKICE